jgi:hypothetical protein
LGKTKTEKPLKMALKSSNSRLIVIIFWLVISSIIAFFILKPGLNHVSVPISLLNSFLIYLLIRKREQKPRFLGLPLFAFLIMFFNFFSEPLIFYCFLCLAILSFVSLFYFKKNPIDSILLAFVIYLMYLLITISSPITIILLNSIFLLLILSMKEKPWKELRVRGLFKIKKIIKALLILLVLWMLLLIGKPWPFWLCFSLSLAIFILSLINTKRIIKIHPKRRGVKPT